MFIVTKIHIIGNKEDMCIDLFPTNNHTFKEGALWYTLVWIIEYGRSQNLHHFISACGSNWGSSGFSHNQNNHNSLGAYVTCIHNGLSIKISMYKTPHDAQRSRTHLFLHAWSATTQRPLILAPWLTTSLHGAVYEVCDLPCISVVWIHYCHKHTGRLI